MGIAQKIISKINITTATLTSIVLSVAIGLILRNYSSQQWSERSIMYLQFPGELFLRLVNSLILPLVFFTIVSASCNLSKSGSIGTKAFVYYFTTTSLGITLSVILSQSIKPGKFHFQEPGERGVAEKHFLTEDTILDLFRNLITDNLIGACISQYQTLLLEPENKTEAPIHDWKISQQSIPGTNVLGLVFFSLILGIAIGKLSEDAAKPLAIFCENFSQVTMILMNMVTMYAPIAILFVVPGKILSIEDFGLMVTRLGLYVVTVFLGLILHGLVILPSLFFLLTRKSPYRILRNMFPAFLTAFGTSSSTATVPVTIRCLDEMGIDSTISRFVAPIGATINMDGIALYETIGALFIIQMKGLEFSLARTIAISITCTVSCIGAAGLPSGGYMMLIMVLNSIGVSAEDVTLIIAIDSLVDRFRTTLNIVADALGTCLIAHYTRREECRDEYELKRPLRNKETLEE